MPQRCVVPIVIAAMTCSAVACGKGPSEPEQVQLVLVAVDGHAIPYQVGVTTSGQPLIVYSGYVFKNTYNSQCMFSVKLDPNRPTLSFTNEYYAFAPGECILNKGEQRSFTYTFPFRNSTANTAHTFVYQ